MSTAESTQVEVPWESLRTDETRLIEDALREQFPASDAYRYNSASIRVRVVDPSFSGKSIEERDDLVAEILDRLPAGTQQEILMLLTLTPEEIATRSRRSLANLEFEDASHPLL